MEPIILDPSVPSSDRTRPILSRLVGLLPAFALCLGVTAVAGCDQEPEISDLLADYVDELNLQAELGCDCWQELGWPTRSDCVESSGYIGPSQMRCVEDAFARDEETARAWLDCVIALEREFTACVDQRLVCEEDPGVGPCFDDYSVGYGECVGLPENIERNMDSCFGSEEG